MTKTKKASKRDLRQRHANSLRQKGAAQSLDALDLLSDELKAQMEK